MGGARYVWLSNVYASQPSLMHGIAAWQNNTQHGRMRWCMAVTLNAHADIAFIQRIVSPSSPGEGLSAAGSSESQSDPARAALCKSFDKAQCIRKTMDESAEERCGPPTAAEGG